MAGAWKSRPVFITSTFLDMQAERDVLRDRVFPALEERLKARRAHLEWIDLRVGVRDPTSDKEGAREAEALKVCLAEVKRSRPFLVGLIGDRYGWTPSLEQARAAVAEAAEAGEKAIGETLEGRSVTELEIAFGVLASPEQRKRSLFWLREPLPYGTMTSEDSANYSESYAKDADAPVRTERLEALKTALSEALPGRVIPYEAQWDGRRVTGLEAWAKKVEERLWAELEAEIPPPGPAPSWQEEERLALADFAEDRARDFVGRNALRDEIIAYVASKPEGAQRGLVITGDSGSGKSALWGLLHAQLSKAKNLLLLSHAAGASPRAASVDQMLRRWIEELSLALGVTTALEDNAKDEEVETAFTSLLGRVALQRRVLILIDALDQFETTNRGRFVTWLPKLWPENARLIATAISGEASEALSRLPGMKERQLPPLDEAEARAIVTGVCKRYHREFEPEVVEALGGRCVAEGPARGNALWLTLATEALNLVDADDFARAAAEFAHLEGGKRNAALMLSLISAMPVDIPGLYGQSFDRAAKLYGERNAWAFLGAIAVSRGGWRELDFRGVLPRLTGEDWDELRFAQLRRAFRGQLRSRGALAQWDFAHRQMRDAFRAWNARRELGGEMAIHTAIGDNLLAFEVDDPLRVSEVMLHLMEGDNGAQRASFYYGDPQWTETATSHATRVLSEYVIRDTNIDKSYGLKRLMRLVDVWNPYEFKQMIIASNVSTNYCSLLLAQLANTVDSRVFVLFVNELKNRIDRLIEVNPNNEYLQANSAALILCLANVTLTSSDITNWLNVFHEANLTLDRSTLSFEGNRKLECIRAMMNIKHSEILTWNGLSMKALENYMNIKSSLLLLNEAEMNSKSSTNVKHLLAIVSDHIADILLSQGRLNDAYIAFEDSKSYSEVVANVIVHNEYIQDYLAYAIARVGDVQLALGNKVDALNSFRESARLRKLLVNNSRQNNLLKAGLASSYFRAGDACVSLNDSEEAFNYFEAGAEITCNLAKGDPSNLKWQHENSVGCIKLGDINVLKGKFIDAIKSFREAYQSVENLVRVDNLNRKMRRQLSVCSNKIGEVYVRAGQPGEALNFFQQSIEIMSNLVLIDRDNAGWWRDLAVAHHRFGSCALEIGQSQSGVRSLEKSLSILKDLDSKGTLDPATRPAIGLLEETIVDARYSASTGFVKDQRVSTSPERSFVAAHTYASKPSAAALLRSNAPAAAKSALLASAGPDPASQNLLAVCHLRLGEPQAALDALRKLLLPAGQVAPAYDADPNAIVNLATAHLMLGDAASCRKALGWVRNPNHSGAIQVKAALEAWEAEGGGRRGWFSRNPPEPPKLTFTPGVF